MTSSLKTGASTALPLAVTVWVRWSPPEQSQGGKKPKSGQWDFNHLEDGHSPAVLPNDDFGRGWKSATWRKRHGFLVAEGGKWGGPVLVYEADGVFDLEPATEVSQS